MLTLSAVLFASVTAAAQPVHATLPRPQVLDRETGVTVRMSDFGGRPVIHLMLAGRGPYAAIVDTGASSTVIDEDLARELRLPKSSFADVGDVDGSKRELVEMKGLEIGSAKIKGLLAATAPLGHFMKQADAPKIVLSAEAFPGRLLSFDFAAHTLSLHKGTLGQADEREIFAYTEEEMIPWVSIKVGNVARRVHLDTGSPKGLTLPTEYMTQVPLTSEAKLAGIARTSGGEFKMYRASLAVPIEVGALKLTLPEIVFSDVRPGGDVSTSAPPGNLGSAALGGLVITVDAGNRRVQVLGKGAN